MKPEVIERFNALVGRESGGCWLWRGYIAPHGYGKYGKYWAHRLAYEIASGPIPSGAVIDHKCCVRSCVNPDHLEAVTPKENVERTVRRGRHFYAARTHCPKGHPFAGDNLCSFKRNRVCLACARESGKKWRDRQKVA